MEAEDLFGWVVGCFLIVIGSFFLALKFNCFLNLFFPSASIILGLIIILITLNIKLVKE